MNKNQKLAANMLATADQLRHIRKELTALVQEYHHAIAENAALATVALCEGTTVLHALEALAEALDKNGGTNAKQEAQEPEKRLPLRG
jgi:hypothetical protein